MTKLVDLSALLAFFVVGCGGDEGGIALLDIASQKTTEAESYRQELSMDTNFEGETMTMEAEGISSADQQNGEMSATMKEGDAGEIAFDIVVVDGTLYMRSDDLGLPPGKEWLKTPESPTSTLTPSQFVDFLRDSDGVEEAGTEEIRGEETTHLRGPVDIANLAEEGGLEGVAKQFSESPEANKLKFMIDVWVTDDGLPSRMMLEITHAEEQGRMTMTSDLLEYDVPLEVEAPPDEDVAEGGDLGQGA